ncbi:unnamed protein product, partial [Brassica oleracea]
MKGLVNIVRPNTVKLTSSSREHKCVFTLQAFLAFQGQICTLDPNSLCFIISDVLLAASYPDYLFSSSHLSIKSTRKKLTSASEHQTGHVFYKKPIGLSSSKPLSFSTHFVCALVPRPGYEGGHGIAFVVSPSMDFSHAQPNRYLGVFNTSTIVSPSSHVLAVELDIIWNPEFSDIDNNHVGIDVNSSVSVGIASASYYSDMKRQNESINLLSGKPIQVWVDYEGTMLNVSMAPLEVKKPSRPLLSQHINLTEVFPNSSRLFVGFSASSGAAVSDQYIVGFGGLCFVHLLAMGGIYYLASSWLQTMSLLYVCNRMFDLNLNLPHDKKKKTVC